MIYEILFDNDIMMNFSYITYEILFGSGIYNEFG
jgi:hypothetical protein